jgi:ankyrin repeat protein
MSPANRKIIKAAKGRADDLDRAIAAIRAGGDPNSRDEYNLTVFMWCARKGHIAVARVLTAAGADIEARDNCQRTAVHHAVLFSRSAFIGYLLSLNADLAALDMHGCTALDLALYQDGLPRIDRAIVPQLTAAGAPAPNHPEHRHATAGNA